MSSGAGSTSTVVVLRYSSWGDVSSSSLRDVKRLKGKHDAHSDLSSRACVAA